MMASYNSQIDFSAAQGDDGKVLSVDEQIFKWDAHLRRKEKFNKPVAQDGLCILKSCMVGYEALGLDGLKELLKDQFDKDIEFYQSFSDDSVDIIQETRSFIADPSKNYSLSTVDLFLDAIGC